MRVATSSRFAPLCLAALCLPLLARTSDDLAAAERPNVLFIAVDDLKPELGCYGRPYIHSPNIDRLAASGLRFERAYCQVAVCGATRTSLLTGLRPDTTGVYGNSIHFRKVVPQIVTLPQHFKNHGYHVEGMGKIFHHDDKDSWSVPLARPETPTLTWRRPENAELVDRKRAAFERKRAEYRAAGKKASWANERRALRGPAYEAADVKDDAYFDGQLCDMALASLRRAAGQEQPFFLAVGFIRPHLPFVAPQRYWDLYDPAQIELADNPFKPSGAPDLAMHNWGELRTYHDIPLSGPLNDDLSRTLVHGYYACVSYTDALVGRLLDELDRLDMGDETIVVLWGDHGWHLGDHGLWCKHSNFESATHVPIILRVPAMRTAGRSTIALVEFLDIFPSLCELADLPLPQHLEGRSFAPLLVDPDARWKPAAFSQYPRGQAMGRSMRTDRYRLTVWQDRKDRSKVQAVELYDHQNDPAENVNLAAEPDHAALLKEMLAVFQRQWPESDSLP